MRIASEVPKPCSTQREKTANTVKNVIRHILEYYFIQICGYEGNDLHKIVLEQNKLYYMLVRMLQKMKKDLMFGNFVMN